MDDLPQTQNQLLSEWLQYRDTYLQEILELEAPPAQAACQSCKINDFVSISNISDISDVVGLRVKHKSDSGRIPVDAG